SLDSKYRDRAAIARMIRAVNPPAQVDLLATWGLRARIGPPRWARPAPRKLPRFPPPVYRSRAPARRVARCAPAGASLAGGHGSVWTACGREHPGSTVRGACGAA